MSDVTLELTDREADALRDAVRWSRENAEEKNLKRVTRKMQRLEDTLGEQIGVK